MRVINDTIHGSFSIDGVKEDLLSTPEFNKLSHIKQLGLAHLVFPGAHHTRFEHSLGVSHLAGRMADSLSLSEEESTIVEVAAMLHDVGHGPYSHTLEHILHERGGADHMHITEGIITGDYEILSDEERSLFPERRTVPEILESYGIDPKEVSSLIHGPDAGGKERNLFHWGEGAEAFHSQDHTMGHLVHGPVDCDQMDYLLRDAHFTGVRHGIIDHHRLIHCMERHSGDIAISEGGLSALEGMMTARALMYSAVYFHKVTRITEVMLSRAVERSEENLPEAVQMQRMVDAEVWHALDSAGPFAKDMIKRLKYRQLLKNCLTKRMDELTPAQIDRLVHLATNSEDRIQVEDEIARRSGLDPGYVCIDVPSIKLLLSEPRMAAVDVRIIGKDGRTRWFREHTPVADALRKRQVSQNAMSVITLKGYEEAVANIAERIIYL
ncbi:MAG: HD domain-containing protein [Candidatus Thermoplasmatota archaeon]|nr:HD domain-containing protein [Candidatus Thermoplasmatota archaeon]MEC7142702.1 HD domain-containing protein [Candidatus Thermoplasmatota archaeon]MEC7436080.1 HD domain-containing protein [Candidatus Thermoplasmatota archaeon]MEC7544536.1 HD domain-containing protein [Candidatus Thermoplasmatota archaeon]MEC8384676.1 HD domain-containing protein [Candidatus Thermoplasmatota archaeon]|tara:strand:- start:2573 stop:3889 length:1317 start_codon:yes stop_codon:yes gene_type:complete